jgi:hypothetical protein
MEDDDDYYELRKERILPKECTGMRSASTNRQPTFYLKKNVFLGNIILMLSNVFARTPTSALKLYNNNKNKTNKANKQPRKHQVRDFRLLLSCDTIHQPKEKGEGQGIVLGALQSFPAGAVFWFLVKLAQAAYK